MKVNSVFSVPVYSTNVSFENDLRVITGNCREVQTLRLWIFYYYFYVILVLKSPVKSNIHKLTHVKLWPSRCSFSVCNHNRTF